MVIYPPAKQPLLEAVTASVNWNKTAAYRADLVRLQQHQPGVDIARFPWHHPGFGNLALAWDHIQLGDFAEANADIQRASSEGAPPLIVQWLQQAVSAASA